MVKQWKRSLSQSDILSDGQPFDGANIDAPISQAGADLQFYSANVSNLNAWKSTPMTEFVFFDGANSIRDVGFKPDGTILYVLNSKSELRQWSLSTPFDVTSKTFNNKTLTASDSLGQSFAFNSDGTKVYIFTDSSVQMESFNLSTAYDLSTGTSNNTVDMSGFSVSGAGGMTFNDDGTKLLIYDSVNFDLVEFSLSTGFDISTLSRNDSFGVGSQTSSNPDQLAAVETDSDGDLIYLVDTGQSNIIVYSLVKDYTLNNISFMKKVDLSEEHAEPFGLTLENNGEFAFTTAKDTGRTHSYQVGFVGGKL